jgi:hypothetical protein
MRNWPPVWTHARNDGGVKRTLMGEVGVLKHVLSNSEMSKKCYLVIDFEGERYVGTVLCDDHAFSLQIPRVLEIKRDWRPGRVAPSLACLIFLGPAVEVDRTTRKTLVCFSSEPFQIASIRPEGWTEYTRQTRRRQLSRFVLTRAGCWKRNGIESLSLASASPVTLSRPKFAQFSLCAVSSVGRQSQ